MPKVTAQTQQIIKHCSIRKLTDEQHIASARHAIEFNHHNAPHISGIIKVIPEIAASPLHLAMVTKKYWGIDGVKLTVGFLDNPPQDLRRRLLSHMNAWGEFCNVKFVASNVNPQVRISRSTPAPDNGYWSYLGTEILTIPADQPTMSFTVW
jgi:hypothetical protein